MKTFEYYFIERNGLWSERLREVKDKGFEGASPIARLIYECERDNINQHASEDLKAISAKLQMLEDMESVITESHIDTSAGKLPFYETADITAEEDTARMVAHQAGDWLA